MNNFKIHIFPILLSIGKMHRGEGTSFEGYISPKQERILKLQRKHKEHLFNQGRQALVSSSTLGLVVSRTVTRVQVF